jgi:LmbE family N-acetylglucosaminyl deacetylase
VILLAKVMVFAPHPDDDIIGCGGSIARHIYQGEQVAIVYLTSGEAGSLRCDASRLAALRENEAQQAAQLLGTSDLTFLRYQDGYLEYTQAGLDTIVGLIRQFKPNRIYLPHSQEAVPDHQTTYRLVSEGMRRAAGPWFQQGELKPWRVETILGYEVWTPLAVIGHSQDISEFMKLKLEALRMHQTQIESIRYDEAVEGLNRYRGVMTGLGTYCECFQLIRASL